MALSAAMDWYIRASGNNTNGGGFDDTVTSPGTNYADADAVKYTGTNLTVSDAVAAKKVIPDGHTPDSTDVGNVVRISTNTGGWTYGYYTITAQDGTTWTLDRSPAADTTASGAWRMGGAFATIWALHNGGSKTLPTVPTPLAAGHQVNIRGAGTDNPSVVDHDWDDGYGTFPDGTVGAGRIRWVGYNGRPLIGHWGLLFYGGHWHTWSNLSFKQTASDYTAFGVISSLWGVCVTNCYFDQAGIDTVILHLLNYASVVDSCWFYNSGSKTATAKAAITDAGAYPLAVLNCVFEDLRGYALSSAFPMVVIGNIFHACRATSYAVFERSSGALNYVSSIIMNNTFDDNDGGGIKFLDSNSAVGAVVRNNIFANTTTSAALDFNAADTSLNDRLVPIAPDYNCFYNNSDDRDYISAGANDVTTDPTFAAAASGNWAVGTNMKAEGVPGLMFPASGTTNYVDLGAVQRQEPAGGGTTASGFPRRVMKAG